MLTNIRYSYTTLQRLYTAFTTFQQKCKGVPLGFVRKMATRRPAPEIQEQKFDYFLVLDLEATCDDKTKIKPQEIIEFPVLKVNGKTFQTESVFHHYVQPTVNPELTSFCTDLTGIVQDMVNGQPNLEEVLKKLDVWMEQEGLFNEDTKSIFVTCGDWDLKVMLPGQCRYLNINYPGYLKKWINIKKPYADITMHFPKGMIYMLSTLGIKHEGRHHSGIDDCKNIAKIVKAIAERGQVFKPTGAITTS